jgi:hypothetical protein
MADVFISYSRKDIAFARLLHRALHNNEMETWIDWQDIPPSADWLAEVYEAIEQAETFIFIISETSAVSEVCSLEIAHATRHNKRLIPIVINDIDPTVVPPQLAALNWIFFRDSDAFSKPLAVYDAPLTGAALNPDGNTLALSAADGNLILWDMLAGSWIGLPIAADAQVLNAAAFLPDGRLATAGVGGVSLWEMELSAWQDHACKVANRNLSEEEWVTYLGDVQYRETCPNLP